MSTNRGIFDSFPSQPVNRQDSPFTVAQDAAAERPPAPGGPFTTPERGDSPFRVVDEAVGAAGAEAGKVAKLPERRKTESPFQVAEPSEGFGFEAPAAFEGSPFQAAPAAPVQPASPFSVAAQPVPAPPFATEPAPPPPVTAFAQWQEPAPQRVAVAAKEELAPPPFSPAVQVPSVFGTPQAPEQPAAPAPAAPVESAVPSSEPQSSQNSDSFSIRQLELRAIFGVDREMNGDEILQRSRALPGMRNIARVDPQGMATIDALKSLLPTLGFGSGSLKLYSGSVPLEFIREGSVLLAVQTDGGFAPGVRETLMIVARELDRMG